MKILGVEGLDAAGKHTAVLVLENYYKSMGLNVATCSFPNYGSRIGDLIHEWLRGSQSFDKATFELLQAADKQAAQGFITKCEQDGVDILIIDRYVHSQWAYGSYHFDMEWLQELTVNVRMPDAVVYMDVEPEVSMHRRSKYGENDKYEADLDRLRHARRSYLEMLGGCPDMQCQIIDANQPELIVRTSLFHAAKRLSWLLNLTGERHAEAVN